MQKIIDVAVKELISIIDSKKHSKKVAMQFVLEELDAARQGNDYVKDKIKSFYFNESDYIGAMESSWEDVDGPTGPQQFLVVLTMQLSKEIGIDNAAMVRISIVEYIVCHYKFGRYYLDEEIRRATKPLKLFDVLVDDENFLHPNFKYLLESKNKPLVDVISRWASGFEDRDNKFNYEFQTTFNSSFWEVYLYQCFKDLNLNVDFSKASPDFTVKTSSNEIINIEAVTANHAQDSSPEWENEKLKENGEFLNFASVRILNAINSKHKKYLSTYSKFEHVVGNPFVVAVAPFEQNMFFIQNNEAINRVLYGQGIDKDNGFTEVEVPFALKNEKVALDLGIFTNDKYKEVSAIIFSTMGTLSKAITQSSLAMDIRSSRYHDRKGLIMEIKENNKHFETHLDGLQIHHNPYAINKLSKDVFDRYEVTHYYYDIESRFIDNQQKSYTMISRSSWPSSSKTVP
ncbi:hypothetical protein HQN60_11815 [Deefgea piscis]|uniref:Uncharacterized protein n=1 Tax=Deefgea piscis TaxID=2739061 RepID=A0A6M8SXM1_9NEIS|nr:hypothetical protein [Deefgea piscis]QKJ67329.1 hypothetical protein HQN60_11815 [Deefgea piscis]